MSDPNSMILSEKDIIQAGYITNELLPCPFCGNKSPITVGNRNQENGNIGYKVICPNHFGCGATMHNCFSGDTLEEECRNDIVKKWNTRKFNPYEK